jgi:hypothetical protein
VGFGLGFNLFVYPFGFGAVKFAIELSEFDSGAVFVFVSGLWVKHDGFQPMLALVTMEFQGNV